MRKMFTLCEIRCMMEKKITSGIANKYTKEGKVMVIMDLELDNFFAFRHFKLNMSYPKRIVDSYIDNEFLKDRENFRYKKVNILMGANATGKTSIGLMLMRIFNFIDKKEAVSLTDVIGNPEMKAALSLDFVTKSYRMYRLNVEVEPAKGEEEKPVVRACTRYVRINKADRYETCVQRVNEIPCLMREDYGNELDKIEHLGWMFSYPADVLAGIVRCSKNPRYTQILDHVLRSLDSLIKKVEKLEEVENTYVIRTENRDLVMQDGKVISNDILSSGTRAGIDIAGVIAAIRFGECGFYYCDEKFSYIHSDMEKAFLSVMIDSLLDNEQLFFTTHNMDILDMPLPKHTFTFLKKDPDNLVSPIKCVSASQYLKRSTDSVKNAVENDLFSVAPNLELIYEIADI